MEKKKEKSQAIKKKKITYQLDAGKIQTILERWWKTRSKGRFVTPTQKK